MNPAHPATATPPREPIKPATGEARRAAPVDAAYPPGPHARWWGLPLLGRMRADYLGFTTGLQREHGDITCMRIARERAYDLFTPELVRSALVDQAAHLVRWERGVEVFEQVFGQSVLVTEGATWQRQRRMLQAAFTPRRVAGYAELMNAAALHGLTHALPAGQAQGLVDMDALFARVTMDVIMRTLFSSQAPGDARDALDAVQELSQVAMREMFWPMTLPDWLPLGGKAGKRRALKLLHGLVARHIARRREAGAAEPATAARAQDLLAMLLALRDEGSGAALSEREVFDQCMVSFQAGHETSATALIWWSRLLAEHPAAAGRAQREVDQALGGRPPGPQDAAALPWLSATLKEAMRLYPPVPALLTRRTTAPMQLSGWNIPAGALLRVTPWVLHRDPRNFEQADSFHPERFLPDAAPPPRGAWMPFGTGPRVCLGQHFAMLEMTLIAALMLQRYTLALPAAAPPLEAVVNVTLRPRGGVQLRLARRSLGSAATPPA